MSRALRIGIDLGGTKIEAVLLDGSGRVVFRERLATPQDYDATVGLIADLVGRIDAGCGVSPPVGIGTPGAWVESTRTMKNCNSTWLNGKPLLDDLNVALAGRVRIANDANCFALSEALAGVGRGAHVVFGVILGTGVGGGIVVDGQLLGGANAVAGEWGHTPLPYLRSDRATMHLEAGLRDRSCYCGRTNCVETFLSGPGLAKTHLALTGVEASAEEIAADARSIDLYTTMLARALAQIVNVIDPDVIVLGGGLSNIEGLARGVAQRMARYGFSHEGATRVRTAEHGDASGVLGACWLWSASGLPPKPEVKPPRWADRQSIAGDDKRR